MKPFLQNLCKTNFTTNKLWIKNSQLVCKLNIWLCINCLDNFPRGPLSQYIQDCRDSLVFVKMTFVESAAFVGFTGFEFSVLESLSGKFWPGTCFLWLKL